jgi:hypothetical protein
MTYYTEVEMNKDKLKEKLDKIVEDHFNLRYSHTVMKEKIMNLIDEYGDVCYLKGNKHPLYK